MFYHIFSLYKSFDLKLTKIVKCPVFIYWELSGAVIMKHTEKGFPATFLENFIKL